MSRLFSLRMRASSVNRHVSGAERIAPASHIESLMAEMIKRAINSRQDPDEIVVSIESLDQSAIFRLSALNVTTLISSSCSESQVCAKELLSSEGISPGILDAALSLLQNGPTPEKANMRGAVIMDAVTGTRLEPDVRRGIRVSRMDYSEDTRRDLAKRLHGFGIYHERLIEGLAIATKTASRKETIAELCWSDHPDYTTGYVSSSRLGYVRITNMKVKGSIRGGRILFVNTAELDLDQYIHYLEKQAVMIDQTGEIFAPDEKCLLEIR